MIILRVTLTFLFWSLLSSLISLGLGVILAKTIRFHRLGVNLIARSVLVPGYFISTRCHQHCEFTRCSNWNCDNYHHCLK